MVHLSHLGQVEQVTELFHDVLYFVNKTLVQPASFDNLPSSM